MPLPAGGKSEWPPVEQKGEYWNYAQYGAWYGGDPVRLAAVYGGAANIDSYLGYAVQSSKDKGGPMSWLRGMFWARRSTALPFQRMRLHVPLAADIATTSSDLLFSKSIYINVGDAHKEGASTEDKDAQTRLEELMQLNEVRSTLIEAAESCAALGGVYLRVSWDKNFADRPLLNVIQADNVIPTFQWGELRSAILWRVVQDSDGTVFRQLECHEIGKITHALYQGDKGHLGYPVSYDRLDKANMLADGERNLPAVIDTQLDKLTVVYVPNMRPNRGISGSPSGRSDYQGAVGLMDALDEVYTSWMRDIRLARARLIVPEQYLEGFGKGGGAGFDVDNEVYTPMKILPGTSDDSITINQFAIRHAEHAATAKNLVERVVSTAGYSYSTFGLAGDEKAARPATATEVAARERRSLITREKKSHYWGKPLADILEVMLLIDQRVFNGKGGGRPTIVFPDGAPTEPLVTANTLNYLAMAKAVSTQTMVEMLHPEFEPDDVAAEVARIQAMPQPAGAPAYSPDSAGQTEPPPMPPVHGEPL
jgi:A118 family predicted phage portal protein